MRLVLTPEQVAIITPHLRLGVCLLARIDREMFDGSNAATSGTLGIEFGTVPVRSLDALRAAVRAANSPQPEKPKRTRRKATE